MDKNSADNFICTYCDKPAIKGTYPPVCSDHASDLVKTAAKEEPKTLKELETRDE